MADDIDDYLARINDTAATPADTPLDFGGDT